MAALIAFYVSGHGFGHASRDIELIHALLARRSGMRVVVRTSVRPSLFSSAFAPHGSSGATARPSRSAKREGWPLAHLPVEIESVETDTGLAQINSLRFDEDESARQAERFYATFDERVRVETERLRAVRADVVVGDIPPLAFAAAERAGVPSVAVANFTWDWIYSIYPAFERHAPDVMAAIRGAYARATRALRLPLHGGFEPMAAVTRDIPFIARRSARDRRDTRRALNITDDRPVVLPSFGAYGAPLPIERLRACDRFTLIDPTRPLPHGFLYQDLVAAADVVVSKPGYGIVSECAANETALLYTSRGRFIEYDLFVAEMPRVLRCRHVSLDDLFAGRWADAIDALLAQPAPPEQARIDGADVAADHILDLIIE